MGRNHWGGEGGGDGRTGIIYNDVRACALAQENVLNMSICIIRAIKSIGQRIITAEIFSHLKEFSGNLIENSDIVLP